MPVGERSYAIDEKENAEIEEDVPVDCTLPSDLNSSLAHFEVPYEEAEEGCGRVSRNLPRIRYRHPAHVAPTLPISIGLAFASSHGSST